MKRQRNTILIVDDDANDLHLIVQALSSIGVDRRIHALKDGSEAIAYLQGKGEYANRAKYEFPTMVITDLKMPLKDGFAVLDFLKSNPALAVIPVIMLSGAADLDDIKQAYLLGASSFFAKPGDFHGLKSLLKRICDYWEGAEVPQVDAAGVMLATERAGKLGQRFARPPSSGSSQKAH